MSFRIRHTNAIIDAPLKPKNTVVEKKKDDDDVDDQKVNVGQQPQVVTHSERTKTVGASFGIRPNFGGKSDFY